MSLIPFLLFAFVASITPGPTNILVLTNSQHFGVKNTVPAILGGCIAASAIVLVSGAGAGGSAASVSSDTSDNELDRRAVAKLDELAAVSRPGSPSLR